MKSVLFFLFVIFLAGCGQKGALYLPNKVNDRPASSSVSSDDTDNDVKTQNP